MTYQSEFMCSCDPAGVEECANIRARARKIVESSSPCYDDLNFVDRMLYWLAGEGDVHIAADQWAGVSMTPFDAKPEVVERYAVKEGKSFSCDSIVDGLAALVVHYFENTE